ncbi:hypothetical protein Tco_1563513 [Tanacetum coccineum]
MLGNIKDKALEGKQVTTDAAGSAWEKTIESKDQAGTKVSETSTAVVDKASQIAQSTQETAVAGKDVVVDKASQIAQSTQETAVAGKENTGGVLQSTGETIMNVARSTGETVVNAAQGATETVKNTLGMGTKTTTPVKESTDKSVFANTATQFCIGTRCD